MDVVERASSREVADRELLVAMRTGDQSAFDELFTRHYRPVLASALARMRSRPDAEDVAQEAFALLWERRHGIALAGDSVLPWLLVTVRYLGLNRLRSIARRATEGRDLDLIAAPGAGVDDVVHATRLVEAVEAVVAGLSEIDREVYRLCLVDGRSYDDAARRLGLPSSTLRGRLARLRARLRGEIGFMRGRP